MSRTIAALALVISSSLFVSGVQPSAQSVDATNSNVVLITFDGARVEEVFGGLDLDLLTSTLKDGQKVEDTSSYRRFWAPTPEERRRKLMPFFWNLVTEQGSIAGDPRSGSVVRLGNMHWFSYPGYAEMLLGEAHDTVITTNDPIRTPAPTVLETIGARLSLPRDKVATVASWAVFNAISEQTVGATFINAGVEHFDSEEGDIRALNALQAEVTTPWDGIRFDAFTFRVAMRHLATARPRAMHVAFDETDDWAHDGRYERVLDSYARTDEYLRELWAWMQSQPDYRGRTHLLITTDHGRGHTVKDWRDHGAKVPGSNEVWMAFVSPRMPQRGLRRNHTPLTTGQVAATLASWMGIDWTADRPHAGPAIR